MHNSQTVHQVGDIFSHKMGVYSWFGLSQGFIKLRYIFTQDGVYSLFGPSQCFIKSGSYFHTRWDLIKDFSSSRLIQIDCPDPDLKYRIFVFFSSTTYR